ncbi:MAG: nitrilase-related carbon-nitrogen hydrolase [Thermodesulfobacteriota bacterium]
MRVAFIQTDPDFGRVRANVASVLRRIEKTDADLMVLPELFSTGYQFKTRAEAMGLAERSDGYTVGSLTGAARKKKAFIVAGFAERTDKRVYNSSFITGPGGLVGVYRKAHLFGDEKRIFTAGAAPYRVFDIGAARVGVMICFDWIMPEVARTLALKGADIIAHPSNLVLPYCPPAMITRSVENRVYTVTCNRVGVEERVRGARLEFIGTSQVVSPSGEVLARAGRRGESVSVVEIDPLEARDKHVTPANDLFRDRRPRLYGLEG